MCDIELVNKFHKSYKLKFNCLFWWYLIGMDYESIIGF